LKDFVELYQEKGKLQAVEKCIVHMDVANLDLHQMVILCWTYGLYDAMIYVYNRGMRDYITPLEELLLLLQSAMKRNKQLPAEDAKIGYKLLVYISYCFAGRGFPTGSIPDGRKLAVKSEVYSTLITEHTKNAADGQDSLFMDCFFVIDLYAIQMSQHIQTFELYWHLMHENSSMSCHWHLRRGSLTVDQAVQIDLKHLVGQTDKKWSTFFLHSWLAHLDQE
jgi:hypothetical protein